jgi:indole-3-glycerol phosphate synthase
MTPRPAQQGFLAKIMAAKELEIERHQLRVSLSELRDIAAARNDHRGFRRALTAEGVNIIAEIKRASPSRGDIRIDLDPAALASAYQAGGAAAVSVLTEQDFFKGSMEDLKAARAACELPVLRKDFIFTEYQIAEAAAIGADAVLLIVRTLAEDALADLIATTADYGLDALVEVHNEADLDAALRCGADLIGINNRNLQTFETDLDVAVRIFRAMPTDVVAVAASGIFGPEDIRINRHVGLHNFLVGESVVRSDDPAAFLAELRQAGDDS